MPSKVLSIEEQWGMEIGLIVSWELHWNVSPPLQASAAHRRLPIALSENENRSESGKTLQFLVAWVTQEEATQSSIASERHCGAALVLLQDQFVLVHSE